MDQLSPAELLQLVRMGESVIDSHFQFWMTATFATIVGAFAGRDLLTKSMRLAICGLYAVATFVFVSRWIYVASDILGYDQRLADLGIENHPPIVTIWGRAVLVGAGAVVTLYFVLRGSRPPGS